MAANYSRSKRKPQPGTGLRSTKPLMYQEHVPVGWTCDVCERSKEDGAPFSVIISKGSFYPRRQCNACRSAYGTYNLSKHSKRKQFMVRRKELETNRKLIINRAILSYFMSEEWRLKYLKINSI